MSPAVQQIKAEVERVAAQWQMRLLTESEATKALARLGHNKIEIAELLKEEPQ